MIEGVNDTDADPTALLDFCKGLLLPHQPDSHQLDPESPYKPSASKTIDKWIAETGRHGIETTLRDSRGSDIAGACGQLKNTFTNGQQQSPTMQRITTRNKNEPTMKTSTHLLCLKIEIPYARFEARIPFEQAFKIIFILELDFNLILAIDGFHLNRRIQNILERTGNLSVFLRHGSLRLSVLVFLPKTSAPKPGFANGQLFLNQLTSGARPSFVGTERIARA